MQVLKKIILSEKASGLQSSGVYGFVVDKEATKKQIKVAVQKKYSVTVEAVNTILTAKKRKFFRTKFGATLGSLPAYKKAFVKLKQGEMIQVYDL